MGAVQPQQTPDCSLMAPEHANPASRLSHRTFDLDEAALRAIALLASGGDARITLDPETGLNRYLSGALSAHDAGLCLVDRQRHVARGLRARGGAGGGSRRGDDEARLEALRARLRAAYRLPDDCAIVFAPSGTDLEYVALACVAGRRAGRDPQRPARRGRGRQRLHPVGARAVSSPTITALRRRRSTPGECVAGLERVSLVDMPVRCAKGLARTTARRSPADIATELALARGHGAARAGPRVHGSKTGLILPELAEIDRLQREWGEAATFVVDACQARITTEALHDYLDREAIVFLTGSKFMGGPPFNGFALVPPRPSARRAGRCRGPRRRLPPRRMARRLAGRASASPTRAIAGCGCASRPRSSSSSGSRRCRWRGRAGDRRVPARLARRARRAARAARWSRPSAPGDEDEDARAPDRDAHAGDARRQRPARGAHASRMRSASTASWRWRACASASRCAACARDGTNGAARCGSACRCRSSSSSRALDDAALRETLGRDMRRIADALSAAAALGGLGGRALRQHFLADPVGPLVVDVDRERAVGELDRLDRRGRGGG